MAVGGVEVLADCLGPDSAAMRDGDRAHPGTDADCPEYQGSIQIQIHHGHGPSIN